ncbi:Gfo/Idh/MocA family oxidoreductase [Desulfuromonas acetoxidans]|uniref:Oxidoreductase-like n=1 Tax=Desulfuromonas acetoxidans (strain DSM 684 / 11070) TaxID=281689 RepID=Q1K174_DESA6|nr:Gfo/Idh/MocA family oxidoreductase [Desulfuromonas acetoxidans]EAT16134.1 oxidoreductase-like [Desulfuromonas acetoxidans DSM 684]MBF0646440.1 Gfo/Idh/MocA family oxidoreductase [Desulfuromonas acetoxidans]NVD25513.1 Gfo/Idh/MocA family oxidoreductase [Desulfuromonas acetoxidans]NVE17537.1 Gfo/Idh/MocA family oxidoreductase [Desulfuromonas acetoxidans]
MELDSRINVLLVGSGNLGRRHLQSLKACRNNLNIYVVDSCLSSLEAARVAYAEVEEVGGLKKIAYFESLDKVEKKINVAILATPATGRFQLIKSLLDLDVDYFILEKIAFNSVGDIDAVIDLLRGRIRGAWVNCPRRLNSFYQDLKQCLLKEKIHKFEVVGKNFGMACNSIHFIDLFSFLEGKTDYKLSVEGVEDVLQSKRPGYVEFFGEIIGQFAGGAQFRLSCHQPEAAVEFRVQIESDNYSYKVDEVNGEVEITSLKNGEIEKLRFRQPFQSELTGPLVDAIVDQGECKLTPLEESMALHRPFIEASYQLYVANFGENKEKRIPIT